MPVPQQSWSQLRGLFVSALAGSGLLMASGLFIGTLGIDDELNALTPVFDGTGRGLWAQQLITDLLPGQLGISFAPMALGCAIYALSIAIVISLWGPIRPRVGYVSAALIGSFPYFASMMTFDVAQVAYPLGFLLISACLIPVFTASRVGPMALSVIAFSLAFSCYQGVATSFATAWASIVGMRYLTASNPNQYLKKELGPIILRTLITAVLGSLVYLLSVKLSQAIIPHTAWSGGYEVQTSFALTDLQRLQQIAGNAVALFSGRSGDAPGFAAALLMAGIAGVFARLCLTADVSWWSRLLVAMVFLASVLVLPFWLLFVQTMPLTPRSAVGLGIIYGYIFAALTTGVNRRITGALTGLAALLIGAFVFTGNEMYYTQFLASQADQVAINRVAARLDSIALLHRLKSPLEVTFVGHYSPASRKFARFDTIGSSPLDWDRGNLHRQASIFDLYGVDGIIVNGDETLRQELVSHIKEHQIPGWPALGSVFLYNQSILVVNFGNI